VNTPPAECSGNDTNVSPPSVDRDMSAREPPVLTAHSVVEDDATTCEEYPDSPVQALDVKDRPPSRETSMRVIPRPSGVMNTHRLEPHAAREAIWPSVTPGSGKVDHEPELTAATAK